LTMNCLFIFFAHLSELPNWLIRIHIKNNTCNIFASLSYLPYYHMVSWRKS
jgi:hypothetical protein